MNAALYIRVSTEDQTEYSPDAQRRLLIDYAKKNNLAVSEEHIFMESVSGRNANKRPQFQNMIALARSKDKPFEKILVWKFSRFARNQEESIVYKNMLKKDGVDVISVSEPIVDGPFGSLIERIIEWMDEYYSVRLSGEVTRGMTEKARRGKIQCSSPYGYKVIKGNLNIVDDEAKVVKLMFDKFVNDDMTLAELCNYINGLGIRNKKGNMFERRNIRYILENPVYCGILRWNYATQKGTGRKVNSQEDWIIAPGAHEAIVSKESFDRAQEKLSYIYSLNTKTKIPTSEYKHWLGGLLRCSSCNGTLTVSNTNLKNGGYYCCNKNRKGSCATSNRVRINQLEKDIISALKYDLSTLKKFKGVNIPIEPKSKSNDEKTLLESQLEKVRRKYEIAKNAYLAEIDTLEEYKANKESIKKEEQLILDKINNLEDISSEVTKNFMKEKLSESIAVLEDDSIDIKTKNDILKTFIKEIIIDKNNDTVKVKYYK